MIKISVKIGMLQRGEKFSQEEKEQLIQIQMNLRVVAKSLITFHQLEHTYDRSFLTMYMEELETSLKNLVRPHLTDKSVRRVEQVLRQLSTLMIIDLRVFSDFLCFEDSRVSRRASQVKLPRDEIADGQGCPGLNCLSRSRDYLMFKV